MTCTHAGDCDTDNVSFVCTSTAGVLEAKWNMYIKYLNQ